MANRQEENRKLLKILGDLIEKYPDRRWGQLLLNFKFVKQEYHHTESESTGVRYLTGKSWEDEFYVEPEVILERVNDATTDEFE